MSDVAPDEEQTARRAEQEVAVVKTHRGELAESTLRSEHDELRRRGVVEPLDSDGDSFPASDPPSGWAGQSEADTERSPVHEVVDVQPLAEDEELRGPHEG